MSADIFYRQGFKAGLKVASETFGIPLVKAIPVAPDGLEAHHPGVLAYQVGKADGVAKAMRLHQGTKMVQA